MYVLNQLTLNRFLLIFQNDNRVSSPQQIVEKALKSNRVDLNSSQQEILKRLVLRITQCRAMLERQLYFHFELTC